MSTQERERQLVRGTITGIEVKSNESWQIVVMPEGSQYVKKLWTKESGLVNQIMAGGIGQRFDFMCSVSHWSMSDGKQVRSLWLDTIAEFGTQAEPAPVAAPAASLPGVSPAALPGMAPAAATAGGLPVAAQPSAVPGVGLVGLPPATPAPAQLPPEVRELRIMRQTASKVAAEMLPHLPPDQRTLAGLEHVAEYFVNYYQSGPSQTATSSNGPAEQAPPAPAPEQSSSDDDIPWTDEQPPDTAAAFTGGIPD